MNQEQNEKNAQETTSDDQISELQDDVQEIANVQDKIPPKRTKTDEEIYAQNARTKAVFFELAISAMWLIACIVLFAIPEKYQSLGVSVAAYISGTLFVLTLFLTFFVHFGASGAMMFTGLIQGISAIAVTTYLVISVINNIISPEWLYLPLIFGDLFLIFSTVSAIFMFRVLVSSKLIELESIIQTDEKIEQKDDTKEPEQVDTQKTKDTESIKTKHFAEYFNKKANFGIGGSVLAGQNSMIVVDSLTKDYGPIKALDSISFSCEKSEIIGFLGPNGAGKSTALKILTTYIQQTTGSAWVAGFNILDEPLEVRRRIGYLPETTPLYKQMKVSEYLKFIIKARRVERSKQMRNLFWVREACGLEPVWSMFISELSKGFKQRVGLAQAMLHEPEILLLDEPSSGLDPNQIIEIRNLIKQIAEEKTVILSTHILQEVTAICSRVMIINQGKLVANGSIDELTKSLSPQGSIIARIMAPPKKASTTISKISSIEHIEIISSGKNEPLELLVIPKLEVTDENLISQEVIDVCNKNNWRILEIKRGYASLEDVFVTLTTAEEKTFS